MIRPCGNTCFACFISLSTLWQVLYILSVLTNYSHDFAEEVLQQDLKYIRCSGVQCCFPNLRIPSQVQSNWLQFLIRLNSWSLVTGCEDMFPSYFDWDYVSGAPFLSLSLHKDICSLLRQMLLGQGFDVFVELRHWQERQKSPQLEWMKKDGTILKQSLTNLQWFPLN